MGTFFLLIPDPNFETDLSQKIRGYLNDSKIRDLDLVSFRVKLVLGEDVL